MKNLVAPILAGTVAFYGGIDDRPRGDDPRDNEV